MPTEPSPRRDIIVIGGSAFSLEPLKLLVSRLPPDFSGCVCVVVHIPAEQPSILPEILGAASSLRAIHPRDKQPIEPGTIYIAPPDHHLLVYEGLLRVSRGPRENRARPAIDPLFRSAARAYGSRVMAVVLSGYLNDGSAGLMAVKMRHGLTVVQDPNEAVSPQMPANALHYAGADCVLSAAAIADLIVKASRSSVNQQCQPEEAAVANHEPHEVSREEEIANLETKSDQPAIGSPSVFACPECHGVMWEIDNGDLTRFRCRVGHSYTEDALNVAYSESVEEALWASMRVMEEKAALLRRMAPRSPRSFGKNYLQEAEHLDRHINTMRRMLISDQKFEDLEKTG
jgi:two-component system chemotaxis response regulator CheB